MCKVTSCQTAFMLHALHAQPSSQAAPCKLLCTLQLPSSSHITYTSAVKTASCLYILLHVFQLPSSFLACHVEAAVACAVHVVFQQLTIYESQSDSPYIGVTIQLTMWQSDSKISQNELLAALVEGRGYHVFMISALFTNGLACSFQVLNMTFTE